MSFSRPIAASSRQVDVPAQPGQVTFAWGLPLFDPADLTILIQASPTSLFQPVTGGVTVTPAADFSSAQVVFLQPPCLAQSQTVVVRLLGRRVQSRLGNVTRGGTVSSSWLEDELDRESLVLQELRRDVDQAVAASAQALLVAGGLPPQPTVTIFQLASALALRGETIRVMDALMPLPSGTPPAIAFASRDAVLAPTDPTIAWLALLLNDTAPVTAARLALAASVPVAPGWSALDFRTACAELGLLDALEATIPADPASLARLEWDLSPTVGFVGPVAQALVASAGAAAALGALPLVAIAEPEPQATLRQLRAALATVGLLGQAEAAIEALPAAPGAFGFTTADLASLQWAAGVGVSAGDPLAAVLGAALGLSATSTAQLLAYAGQVAFA